MGQHDDWTQTSLGEVCIIEDGKRIPINQKERDQRTADKDASELYRYFGATGQVGWIDGYIFDGTRVLLGEDGAPFFDHSKSTAYLAHGRYWVNNHAHVLDALIDPGFLCHQLNQVDYHGHVTGTTRAKLNQKAMREIPLWIAPLVEQRAIVAKIESLFSELDQGVAQLEAVRAQLGRYRQSVLKAAFEGRLTAAWREERRREAEAHGKDQREPLPTADDLLARIRAEREAAHAARLAEWERAVAAWEEAGGKASGTKKPRKPAAPKDPPPLTKEELADLPELPEGWVWCRLGLVIEDPQYGTSKKCRYDTPGRSVLRIPNMDIGHVDPSDLKFAEFDDDEAKAYELVPGDVLIIRSNGSVSLVGRPALITDRDTDHLFAGYLVRLRPIAATLHGDFLTQCLLSHRSRLQIESVARSTSGVNNINSGEIRGLIVPVCTPDEQTEIVNEIDARLSVVDEVGRTIAAALKQAEALRQSILKKAFEGRLLSEAELAAVRADPAYEPADQLLARIRESNAVAAPKKKSRRKRTAAEASP